MPKSPSNKKKAPIKDRAELENKKFNLELQKLRLEEDKSWFEFHKHMTTLNTGVIIIIATLVEKVFTTINPQSFGIMEMSFYSFLASITLSAIGLGYHMPSLRIYRSKQAIGRGSTTVYSVLKYAKAFLLITSLLGFLSGIFFFVAFSLGNV